MIYLMRDIWYAPTVTAVLNYDVKDAMHRIAQKNVNIWIGWHIKRFVRSKSEYFFLIL